MNYTTRGLKQKQRSLNSKGIKLKKMFGITFVKAFLICAISGAVLMGCMGIGMFNGILHSAPDISTIDVTPSGYATNVYDAEGHLMTKLVGADSNRTYVAMDKIPEDLANAFVAIEDERFYEHNGIDIKGIMRAGVKVVVSRKLKQGASTITQQLIKNSVFENWKTEETNVEKVKRKIQEQYLAIELEKTLTKSQILEIYMNTINLGQNTLGVQAASMRYFNKPVYELTLSECTVIAGITKNPAKYNPISHPDYNAERRAEVLKKMLEHQYITKAEYDECLNDNVYERIETVNQSSQASQVYSYFVDEVIEQVVEDLTEHFISEGYTDAQASQKAYSLLYSGGLSIYTTQEPQIQAICDEVAADESNYPEDVKWYLNYQLTIQKADGSLENHSTEMFKSYYKQFNSSFNLLYNSQEDAYAAIQSYIDAHLEEGDEVQAENITMTPQPQISLCIEDQTNGHVLAIVGGRGVKETSRSLNRATNTTRQPGSTFKVVSTFAPALDAAGLTLASVYNDAPYNYSNGRPVKNWYGSDSYKGICSIRYAIEQSLNIITVKTLTQITPQLGFDYLKQFGFTTLVERRVESNGQVNTDITQALGLGGITDGVTNMELNAAYATIANGGIYYEPILYTKIVDHDGNVLIDKNAQQKSRRVLKESTAFLLTSAMQDVVTKGTGGAAAFPGQSIAGKTGTTSDNYDVWFAGFTPYYTCTSWTGYDNNVTMNNAEKNVVKTIWRKSMQQIHEGLESKSFQSPGGLSSVTICSQSGKLPVPGLCDAYLRTEYFAEGTAPTESCDIHYSGTVCAFSHLPACDSCPFKVGGVVQLPLVEDPSVQSGSVLLDAAGNVIYQGASTNKCPHDALFFSDPGYRGILEYQLSILQSMGQNFSLDGY